MRLPQGPTKFQCEWGDIWLALEFEPLWTRLFSVGDIKGEHMSEKKKRLIVVGDRVLIQPEEGEDRTKVGLYLPATAIDSQAVQGGTVVATGPGNAVSAPTELGEEPWKIASP
ncbi:MAG: co-chaperone GroES family protein, partial [Gemmatimonadetes bacterium]|nr:co-chaperone GroES family protein [Gemmatimonadota bacterium]